MKNITKFKSKHLLEVNAENTGNPVNLNVKRFISTAVNLTYQGTF